MPVTPTCPAVDTKAGNSSMCRRGDHRTCTTAGARCSCSCHGANGQTARTPSKASFGCPECDETFDSPQARGAHKRHSHASSRATAPAPRRPVLVELVDEQPPEAPPPQAQGLGRDPRRGGGRRPRAR